MAKAKYLPASQAIGQQFGRLRVVELLGTINHKSVARCICDCGNETIVNVNSLRRGNTKSCGCLHDELAAERRTRHGLSHQPEYQVWKNLIQRCTNPNRPDYMRYGGRAIDFPATWHDYTVFRAETGPRPSPRHSLERIDNSRGYSKENCVWALPIVQQNNRRNNRRITYNGRTQTLQQWLRELNLPFGRTIARLNRGWSVERAFTESPHRGRWH